MNTALQEPFVERFREPNTPYLSPSKVGDFFGFRVQELAERAGMSKQAMADLIEQGIAWGLVQRQPDPLDRRAKRVVYTATGLEWYHSFARATAQAEAEFTAAVGEEVATVVRLALELYGADAGRPA